MSFTITYKPLFTVNILHKYYLNNGMQEYSSMSDDEKRHRMGHYDLSRFADIIPTSATRLKLIGQGFVFKTVKTGFVVWCETDPENADKPLISVDDDLSFTFLLKIKDAAFFNYTDLPFDTAKKLYLFSNKKPFGVTGAFPVINPVNSFTAVDKTYCLTDEASAEITKEVQPYEQRGVFALIRISIKGDNAGLDLLNSQGETVGRGFEIMFGNRKTYWRYIFKKDRSVTGNDDLVVENGNNSILITKEAKPLTSGGFITVKLSGKKLPNAGPSLVEYNEYNENNKTNRRYYSEIYM